MTFRITHAVGVILALAATSAAAESAELTVNISGAEPATGTIEITVFNSEETFFKTPYVQRPCKPADDGSCTVQFVDLPEGEYAVIVVHDANDNHKIDSGFLGFGAESFAYSNGASNPLFGRASFDDAKIRVSGHSEIEISLD